MKRIVTFLGLGILVFVANCQEPAKPTPLPAKPAPVVEAAKPVDGGAADRHLDQNQVQLGLSYKFGETAQAAPVAAKY